MRSQRGLKSMVNNPHSNEGNAVRFKLQQRIVARNSQSLMTNLLLGPATAKDISKDFTTTQVDLLNKFLPVVRDYFLHLIQTKQLTTLDAIKKSLQFLPQSFGKETYWITGESYKFYFGEQFQNFYNNFLADKITDIFAVTLMTLIDMRELLGHNDAQAAFEVLAPLSEVGIALVPPFAIVARAEMAKQVVRNPANFDVGVNDILSVAAFETFTALPQSVRNSLLTQDFLTITITASNELAYIRLDNYWPYSDTAGPYGKEYWTKEKRIEILSHILTAEEIANMPQTAKIVKDSLFDLVQTHYGRHLTSMIQDISEKTGYSRDKATDVFMRSSLSSVFDTITAKKQAFDEGRYFGSITHPSPFDAEYPICPQTVAHNHAEIERGFNALSQGQPLPDDLFFIPFSGKNIGLLPCPPVIPAKPIIKDYSEMFLLVMFIAAVAAIGGKFALSAIRAFNQNNKYAPVATEEASQSAARPPRVIGLFQPARTTIEIDSEDEEENTAVEKIKTSFGCSRRGNRG